MRTWCGERGWRCGSMGCSHWWRERHCASKLALNCFGLTGGTRGGNAADAAITFLFLSSFILRNSYTVICVAAQVRAAECEPPLHEFADNCSFEQLGAVWTRFRVLLQHAVDNLTHAGAIVIG